MINSRIGTSGMSPLSCMIWLILLIVFFPVIVLGGVVFAVVILIARLLGQGHRTAAWTSRLRPGAGRRAPGDGAQAEAYGNIPPASEDTIDVVAVEVEEPENKV